jgi:integrase
MGITCIGDFNVRRLNDYLDRRVVHENIGLTTRHEYLKACRTFCNWAVGRDKSPLRGIRSGGDPRRDPRHPNRAMTRDELMRFFANPNLSPEHLAFYMIAARTGGRWSEVERLRWEHVDFESREIDYAADIAKTGERGTVPMRPEVAEALLAIRPVGVRPSARVFTVRPCPKTWKRHLKQAGIEYGRKGERVLDRKCFRKTFASHLIASGVQPRVLQLLMRHADISTTMAHYSDPALLDVSAAVDSLNAIPVGRASVARPHIVRTDSVTAASVASTTRAAASA